MTKFSVFQLIDLDRTLFDTSKFAKAITDEINKTQPGLGTKLDERFEAAYEKEETFFLLRYLRREKGNEWLEDLVDRIVEKHSKSYFLIKGTHERLAFADTMSGMSPSWGILTYGDTTDQYMKMKIIGLEEAPVYFSHTPNKSEVLQSWKKDDGKFHLPKVFGGGVVEALLLEDDKLRAFQGLPGGVYGIWIAAPGKENHGNSVDIPGNVYLSQNLFESIEIVKRLF